MVIISKWGVGDNTGHSENKQTFLENTVHLNHHVFFRVSVNQTLQTGKKPRTFSSSF